MKNGRNNIAVGFISMAIFMFYGFILIYLRDFSPGSVEWIANSLNGPHFESKLAHAHGNLFALLNIVIGYLLMNLSLPTRDSLWISRLALAGMLMPIGILSEVYFGLSPYLVIIGGISIVTSAGWFGIALIKNRV